MPNHPNRSKTNKHRSRNPEPDEIKKARIRSGQTQTYCAMLVHTTCRVWQQWEAGDRRMHPAFWDLFKSKIGPDQRIIVEGRKTKGVPHDGEQA